MKQTFEDGVHSITNEQYHGSEGISRSALWTFKKAAALYWHEYLNPDYIKPEPKPALIMGDLVHTLVLEPDEFEDRYIMKPTMETKPETLRLKDVGRELFEQNKKIKCEIEQRNKELMDDFNSKKDGKTIITQDQLDLAANMSHRLRLNDTFMAILDGSKVEQSIYFTHDRTGLQVKVRPDIWSNGIVADLKTTEDASPRAFQSSAYNYGYYLQAGMIHEALRSLSIKMDKFVFACVEKKEPNLDALYVLEDAALDYGINLFNKLMDDYAECLQNNNWPAYGIQNLLLPNYSNNEE